MKWHTQHKLDQRAWQRERERRREKEVTVEEPQDLKNPKEKVRRKERFDWVVHGCGGE